MNRVVSLIFILFRDLYKLPNLFKLSASKTLPKAFKTSFRRICDNSTTGLGDDQLIFIYVLSYAPLKFLAINRVC